MQVKEKVLFRHAYILAPKIKRTTDYILDNLAVLCYIYLYMSTKHKTNYLITINLNETKNVYIHIYISIKHYLNFVVCSSQVI